MGPALLPTTLCPVAISYWQVGRQWPNPIKQRCEPMLGVALWNALKSIKPPTVYWMFYPARSILDF